MPSLEQGDEASGHGKRQSACWSAGLSLRSPFKEILTGLTGAASAHVVTAYEADPTALEHDTLYRVASSPSDLLRKGLCRTTGNAELFALSPAAVRTRGWTKAGPVLRLFRSCKKDPGMIGHWLS